MIRLLLVSAIALVFAGAASAQRVHAYRLEALTVGDAQVTASFNGAPTAEAMFTVSNAGYTPDKLVSASCWCAQSVELHRMWMDHGIMRMRSAPDGLDVPAGGQLKLTKDGDHLMLIGLKRPLKAGQRVKITLRFQHNGAATLDFPVVDTAPAAPMHMKM
jgi:copper(I)-binding protein